MGLENLSRPIVPGPSRRTQLRAGERFNWAKDTEASTAASLARDAGLVGCPEYLADRAACVEVLTGGVRGLVKWPFAMELVMGRCMQESRRVLPRLLVRRVSRCFQNVGCRWAVALSGSIELQAGHGNDLFGHPGPRRRRLSRIAHMGRKGYNRFFR